MSCHDVRAMLMRGRAVYFEGWELCFGLPSGLGCERHGNPILGYDL